MPAPLPIVGLNHLALTTRNVAKSTAFYQDVLGFRAVPRPNFSFDGTWLVGHGLIIHLIHNPQGGGPEGAEIRRQQNHFSLHTDNFEAIEGLLQEHGLAYRKSQIPDGGPKQIFFRDPDGHYIEVGQYPPLSEV